MAPFIPCGRSCFYATPERYNWNAGRSECQLHGGDLVMIKTAEKQQEAKEYLDAIWDPAQCNGKKQQQSYDCPQRYYNMGLSKFINLTKRSLNHVKWLLGSILTPTQVLGSFLTPED